MSSNPMNQIVESIIGMEKQLASLRTLVGTLSNSAATKPVKEAKPRAENPWITFNARIDTLMTANDTSFVTVAESKKFASSLKGEKVYADWTDEEILAKREAWATAHPPSCPTCHQDPTDNLDEHRRCILTFANNSTKKMNNTVESWMRASGLKVEPTTPPPEEAPKKVGRPKMTEEQKAAAKAARLVKKAAEMAKPLSDVNVGVLGEDLGSVFSQ